MTQHAFVTGGTGFIGINLIKLLIDKGWEVTALYRPGSDRSPLCNLPINWVQGSVTDRPSMLEAIPAKAEVVFHLAGDTNLWAARNAAQTNINVNGTANVVEAAVANDVSTFIHTSSVAAWGDASGTVTEQTHQQGATSWINYERTKWAGERKALTGASRGMKVIILNPAHVVGPHDTSNWGRLFTALRDDKLPFIAEGCVSIAHVRDVARAHLAAVTHGASGERYILAGENHSFSDFVACIDNLSGTDNMPVIIPTTLFRSYAYLSTRLAGLVNHQPNLTPELAYIMTRKKVHYSSQKAAAAFDFHARPMEKSVRDCYHWLKKSGQL